MLTACNVKQFGFNWQIYSYITVSTTHVQLLMELHLTVMGCHLPYGITLCHLTQMKMPRFNLSQTDLPTPEGWKAEVT